MSKLGHVTPMPWLHGSGPRAVKAGQQEKMAEERVLIQRYFNQGFEYEEIRFLLQRNHEIRMSTSTLKRRLRAMGLIRRNCHFDLDEVKAIVKSILDGPDSVRGYRGIWHLLRLRGISVPRYIVEQLVRELDPEGVAARRAHRLRRRTYQNLGPNHSWHCDGYDKLKPYGFPIHGCIDGWSRKILWLYVTRSNNFPSNIATYYLHAVDEFGGCPVQVITDLGTENGLMAGIQAYFRNDLSSHRYVSSPRNQRIEGWWSFFRRNHSSWWMDFFKGLCDRGVLDLTNQLAKECLWFCFSKLLQKHLDDVKQNWNSHYIRRSRFQTVHGRPDVLFYLPESRNGEPNLLMPVPEDERVYAGMQLTEDHGNTDHQEYFQYIADNAQLQEPGTWREAIALFEELMSVAQ